MTILTSILAAGILLGQLTQNINAITLDVVTDPKLIQDYSVASSYGYENGADMRELFLKVPVTDEEFASLKALQQEDGSWSDINYQDANRGAWKPGQHGFRVQRLAIYYKRTGNTEARDCALRGMDYWFNVKPVCSNWWHNVIGMPRLFGPAVLLLRDEMSPEQLEGAIYVMEKANREMTGQNKVWVAGNMVILGILKDDEEMVRKYREDILSELHVSDSVEGLQKDWSFHQHGPQLQFGNYGLSYACSLSWWARAFAGTGLDIPEDQMEVLRKFLEKGLSQVLWNGWFDMNACGRQVFMNAQRGKAICTENSARNLGVRIRHKKGGIYYPCSDFGIYAGRKWYASVRMQSLNVLGYETTNKENMKSYFSADGALLVRRNGDEYNDIAPIWNWKHVPGTTAYDDGKPLWGNRNGLKDSDPKNLTDKVFGKTKGRRMAAAMEIVRDSLQARKAWFFSNGVIVCLGTGISRELDEPVFTTVEQNLLKGKIEMGDGWVNHNGITYVVLDGSYAVSDSLHTGSWHQIAPNYSEDEVRSEKLFEMVINHGRAPKDASYAYVIVPDGRSGKRAARKVAAKVKILENTAERQTVRIGCHKITADWEKSEIIF